VFLSVGDLLVNMCGNKHGAILKTHFHVVPRIKMIFATPVGPCMALGLLGANLIPFFLALAVFCITYNL
jgi:hypothetical protein